MELSKSSDAAADISARLDRLERSVGKLIDVISQSTLVSSPGASPLVGVDERLTTALERLSQPDVISSLTRAAVVAPPTAAEPAVTELAETLNKPEVQQALTRIASLAPQLELTAIGAAALPELIEEALAVARDKTADTHEGAPLEQRLQALAHAGLRLSHPDMVKNLCDVLVRALPVLDKLSAIEPKTLEQLLSLLELVTAPELQAPLAQLFESLPALSETLLALPTDRSTVALLKAAGDAVSDVVKQGATPVGMFGAMRALGEPEVKRAFGLAVGVARALGGKLGTTENAPLKQLATGE
jgi:uncharacterized protein YjgD (DUF1641 family)